MLFMSDILLKKNIDGACVPRFQLSYINNTNITSHKTPVKLWHDVHHMWLGNPSLELQYWYDLANYKNTTILDIIMLFLKNKTMEYKWHIINIIMFAFVEGATIINWITNMKNYFYNIMKSY